MLKFFFIFWIAVFLAPFQIARAQSSLNLDVRDNQEIYQGLETLAGFGLIPDIIQGQRPFSAAESQNYLSTARKNLLDFCKDEKNSNCPNLQSDLQQKVEELTQKLKPFLPKSDKPLALIPGELQGHFYYLDSQDVQIPASNGIGTIDAKFNPFTQFFAGRHFVDGTQYSWELNHGLQVTPYVLGFAHYRFENLFDENASDDTNLVLHKAYGKFQYKNFYVQAGRDSLIWGQSENGGLLLTNNARPLDMVVLGNDSPFLLPGFLRHLGPLQTSFFLANLGADSYFPYGFLGGYKITIKPAHIFEFGISNIVMLGGEGAPTANFGRTIGDYFGFSDTANGTSNRILGFDGALTLKPWRHTRLYGEVFFDDKSVDNVSDVLKSLRYSTSYTGGFFVPRLSNNGRWQWRSESTYTSQLFYRHGQFKSGMTLNHLLLGDPLGPDGYRFLNKLYWQASPKVNVDLASTFEGRDSNRYTNSKSGDRVTAENPADKRLRNTLHANTVWTKTFNTDLYLGYEHAFDFAYNDGDETNNYFVGINARFLLGR